MDKNICLIGFMGSGKSSVAQELAKRLKVELVSTDQLIEKKTGKRISAIFKDHGEIRFRDFEEAAIKEASLKQGVVIDCGGGVVLRSENLKRLKSNGIVFYLQASPEVIYQRIKLEVHRPLLQVPDPLQAIKELYQQRIPLYNQADFTIDANNSSIEGPIAEILKRI